MLKTVIVPSLISAVITAVVALIIDFLRSYFKHKKDDETKLKEIEDTLKDYQNKFNDFQKLTYKMQLWNFYDLYMDAPNKEIKPEKYAYIKHIYGEYKKAHGNGTTEFEFEEIK